MKNVLEKPINLKLVGKIRYVYTICDLHFRRINKIVKVGSSYCIYVLKRQLLPQ